MIPAPITVEYLNSVIAGCDSRILSEEAIKAECKQLLAEKTGNVQARVIDLQSRTRFLATILRGEGCGGNVTDEQVIQQATAELRQMLAVAEGPTPEGYKMSPGGSQP